jgi:Zn-dependent protease
MLGGFGEDWLTGRVILLIPLWLSLSVHEWAHAWCAYRLGDDTAARLGRMTVNPLQHIDPIGTFALPLLGVPFGWAKPVPINPLRLRAGIALSAAAGPVSNLALAALAAVLLAVVGCVVPTSASPGAPIYDLLATTVMLNWLLAFFNALPVPPLDGSRIADGLLPDSLRPAWDTFSRLGPAPLIGVIVLPIVLGIPIFEISLSQARELIDLVAPARLSASF